MYTFLPLERVIPKNLLVTDLTVLQINMIMMIEDMKLKRIFGGGETQNG